MNMMNLKPAFKYKFLDYLKSAGVFYGIMVVITVFLLLGLMRLSASLDGVSFSGSFGSYETAAAITVFVIGICSIREDLRLMMQHGVGRHTVYVAVFLASLLVSFLLAVAGEALTMAGEAFSAPRSDFFIANVYQMIYADEIYSKLSWVDHAASILCSCTLFSCANFFGMFLSLLFYRLNKFWTIVVVIGGLAFLNIGLPIAINTLGSSLIPFADIVLGSPWVMFGILLFMMLVTAAANWLILYRIPVKPAK